MTTLPNFPASPYVILDPAVRWRPEPTQMKMDESKLVPPLLQAVREGVKKWRDSGYAGSSDTTRALLNWWFCTEHPLTDSDDIEAQFQWYFAQREAVESSIWLYEVQQARDPFGMLRYDKLGIVPRGLFKQDWPRYVMKMATGSGKTKVISLLIAWAYFHKTYEESSSLSTNFLLIAPNIIVLERLKQDFTGNHNILFDDPVLPDNGYAGHNWRDDFQLNIYVQDQISNPSSSGNLFITNIHRVYLPQAPDDNDLSVQFLGKRPTKKTNESYVDLGQIIRTVPDLVIINDEAHHIHDEDLGWFKNIKDIVARLRQKGSDISAQFDLTATPKHNKGEIFVETISDYPLVEAIRQQVVKKPVLPDEESRKKLREQLDGTYPERQRDYLELGYLEWRKAEARVAPMNRHAVLFVMTDTTEHADEVGEYLRSHYKEFEGGATLVIHTNAKGEVEEGKAGKNKAIDDLRDKSNEIDLPGKPYRAIVSVMMLREGWDVQSVCTIVGLRPYTATSKILPEQTLGRGLRLMFRGKEIDGQEEVSVIGVDTFMDFVEQIKEEGVELEQVPMGNRARAKAPTVVQLYPEIDPSQMHPLDIRLPILESRVYYDYKNVEQLNAASLPRPALLLKHYGPDAPREIIFRDIDGGLESHRTAIDSTHPMDYRGVLAYFARGIMKATGLTQEREYNAIYGNLKQFVQDYLFERLVDLEDPEVIRNLAEPEAGRAVQTTFRTAIKNLIVQKRDAPTIRSYFCMSQVRPYQINGKEWFQPKKSIFDKVACDNSFEIALAKALDDSAEIISFARNPARIGFGIEYHNNAGSIPNYYPDFIVKETEQDIWLVEFKGREDTDDLEKKRRAEQWCADATKLSEGECRYRYLYVKQDDWEHYPASNFTQMKQSGS